MLSRSRIIAIGVAAALMIVGLVGVAAAQTDEPALHKTSAAVPVPAATDVQADVDDSEDEDAEIEDCVFDEDWEPTAEELAEINAETEALAEYLRDRGFEVTVETDELGFTYVDFETEDDALFEAMDEFYQQLFADEVAGWSDEEKAEWNAEIDAFVAELEAEGITVETEEIAPGVYDIVWTEALEEALWDLEGDIFFDEDWEPTAEELAEINAETEALAEYLRDRGFEVTVETDELGFTYVDFETEDDALFEAMDEFYQQLFADEVAGWSDEEKAEWNAEIDAFVAELEAEGITVETEEVAPGVYDIVWTEVLEEALWDLEGDIFVDELEEPAEV